MTGWRFGVLLLVVGGCELRGLTDVQLYGPKTPTGDAAPSDPRRPDGAPDTGAPGVDAEPLPRPEAGSSDLGVDTAPQAPETSPPPPPPLLVTGHLTACGKDAKIRVRVGNDRVCSSGSKGYLSLQVHLPAGMKVDLNASKVGYITHSEPLVLEATGNRINIDLKPMTGSCDPPPPTADCTCEEVGCQPPN